MFSSRQPSANIHAEFDRHWRSRRQTGQFMPTLSDYLDKPNPLIQPWTIILDLDNDRLPVRLCGTAWAEMMAIDFTGGDYLHAVRPDERDAVLARDRTCATHPCGLRLELTARTSQGRLFDGATVALPVIRNDGAFSLVRVSEVYPTRAWDDLPIAVIGYTEAAWIDIDAGVPDAAPWFSPTGARRQAVQT